ncbi:MAG: hypothetical protein NTZ20_02830 [Candidatus Levybacteria bacterium]|nr:hypothetical protein [Candidatus Levybacteria bacterium]
MANMCSINIYIPLDKIPDENERQQLTALYEAEKKWNEAVKGNGDLRTGKNRDIFLASQPGVPNKRTDWKYHFFDEEVKSGLAKDGDLEPDSKQWNRPTIHASFQEREGEIWVHPYGFGRGEGLLFDEMDGITVKPYGDKKERIWLAVIQHLPVRWDFKHSFPWWAEIGFAGGKKEFAEGEDAPEGQTDDFYKKWYDEHGQPFPYLIWENPVSQIVENLLYAIKVHENFPLTGLAWELGWVWKQLDQLKDIYRWMRKVSIICPEAIAYLDWSEVAMNSGEFKWTQKNDSPNQIMASIKEMELDAKKLNEGKNTVEDFKKEHALHLRRNSKDYRGYITISKRDPFDYTEWLK